jgi:hypothetical protein
MQIIWNAAPAWEFSSSEFILERGEKHMRGFIRPVAVALTLLTCALVSGEAQAGCYRMGLGGYHWYHSCVGPRFMYPHHRICRHGHCWYR